MTAVLLTPLTGQFFDNNGDPLSGGLIYSYIAGTTTPQATYTDASGTTPAANPVVLNSAGRADVWGSGVYKFIIKDSLGNTIDTLDNVTAIFGAGDMTKDVYDAANIAQQVVGTTAVQTVSNKSLVDAGTYIIDDADPTKRIQFQVSGVTTGTTRTVTFPDSNITLSSGLLKSTPLALVASGALVTFAHGLGARPTMAWASLQCGTADGGYSPGDIIHSTMGSLWDNGFPASAPHWVGYSVFSDTTNLYLRVGDLALKAPRKDTGVGFALTTLNWNVIFTYFA